MRPPVPVPTPDDPDLDSEVTRCTRLLESLLADPGALARVPEASRIALLRAAGRVARPEPDEKVRLKRAYQREKRAVVRASDLEIRSGSGIRVAREAETFQAPPPLTGAGEPPREMAEPQDCYVCKAPYRRIHFFYDSMCPACSDLNYAKRFQTARLDGRVAVVTGGRVKIGFHIALKVLRAGARVIVTTRFPRDAALRFSREDDYAQWADRLQVHGLDLRHTPSVELFARHLESTLDRLDILINNACQTVRRPSGFYAHLLDVEEAPLEALPAAARAPLLSHEDLKRRLDLGLPASGGQDLVRWEGGRTAVGLAASARLSQLPLAYDDRGKDPALFPEGRLDADLQQVDLRSVNSWRLTLSEVETPELLEVHLVNAVAPYVLCARLKALMVRDRTDEKHIVNVSAMEGKFSRGTKTDKHPHTNMAKAALNMMTLTSAPDFVRHGIHMNAVDTGWVTDEDPAAHAARKRDELGFQPPLDIVDGAARVCDPFFSGLITGRHVSGLFLKDYAPTDW